MKRTPSKADKRIVPPRKVKERAPDTTPPKVIKGDIADEAFGVKKKIVTTKVPK